MIRAIKTSIQNNFPENDSKDSKPTDDGGRETPVQEKQN